MGLVVDVVAKGAADVVGRDPCVLGLVDLPLLLLGDMEAADLQPVRVGLRYIDLWTPNHLPKQRSGSQCWFPFVRLVL